MKPLFICLCSILLLAQNTNANPGTSTGNPGVLKKMKPALYFKTSGSYLQYVSILTSKGVDAAYDFYKKQMANALYTAYLPLTAGSAYPLTDTLFGTDAGFTGNVGIGTTSPALKFVVTTSASNFAAQIVNTSAFGGGLNIVAGESTHSALTVNDYTNGTNNFIVYGNGRTAINSSVTALDFVVGNTPGTSAANTYDILTRNPSTGVMEKIPSGGYILNQASQQSSSNFNISGDGYIGGRIGIGTTSPVYPLSVNVAFANFAAQIRNTDSSGGGLSLVTGLPSMAGLIVSDDLHTTNNFIVYGNGRTAINSSVTALDFVVGNTPGTSAANTYDILTRNPSTGVMEKMPSGGYILNQASQQSSSNFNISGDGYIGGNVGVGTSSPQDKLNVNGSAFMQGSTAGVRIGGDNAGSYGFVSAYDQNIGSPKALVFQTGGGNVGIGTTSPSEKLSVNGNIRTKELIVTQTGWSDYVFAGNYKLRSLSALESFIKQNNHLPEIPSAKEVQETGISVGGNQALLLKKIEELTLYVIELNKKNEQLAKRIQILEKKK